MALYRSASAQLSFLGFCIVLSGLISPSASIQSAESADTHRNPSSIDKTYRFSSYPKEVCNQSIYLPNRAKADLCEDGSTSVSQPDAEGLFDYEGRCGQVAWANVFAMMCKGFEPDPSDFTESDLTPGTAPGTLRESLNLSFQGSPASCPSKGQWVKTVADDGASFLKYLKWATVTCGKTGFIRRSKYGFAFRCPVPALVFEDLSALNAHWVSVVDVLDDVSSNNSARACTVVANSNGNQYEFPCHIFVRMARAPVLGDYTFLWFDSWVK